MVYHISKSGDPKVCRAKEGNCPLGSPQEHFKNWQEAFDFISAQEETIPTPLYSVNARLPIESSGNFPTSSDPDDVINKYLDSVIKSNKFKFDLLTDPRRKISMEDYHSIVIAETKMNIWKVIKSGANNEGCTISEAADKTLVTYNNMYNKELMGLEGTYNINNSVEELEQRALAEILEECGFKQE